MEKVLIDSTVFGNVIKYYRQLADGKQAICYCTSIAHSKAMTEEFNTNGIRAVHIDGDTPKQERDDIISRFRSGEITILCNVDRQFNTAYIEVPKKMGRASLPLPSLSS